MRISIALATCNGAAYLEGQIKSILNGSRKPDEWVVVDDASTDGSLELVRSLLNAAGAPGVSVMANPRNIGASASFVNAVASTTGDVILFCDQDDLWHPDKLMRIEEAFAADGSLVLAYHDGEIIDASGVHVGRTIWGTRKHALLAKGCDRDPLEVAANPDTKGCTMAIQGSFARELFARTPGGFHRYWGHDHWAALFAWGSGHVRALPEHLIEHRLHGRNTSGGTRFDPLAPAHWKQRMRTARAQAPDHFVQRYAMAIGTADGSPGFDARLRAALQQHLIFAQRRMALRAAGPAKRCRSAFGLWRDGYYRDHANGLWTLLRDLAG